jgi:hypothetical protein
MAHSLANTFIRYSLQSCVCRVGRSAACLGWQVQEKRKECVKAFFAAQPPLKCVRLGPARFGSAPRNLVQRACAAASRLSSVH